MTGRIFLTFTWVILITFSKTGFGYNYMTLSLPHIICHPKVYIYHSLCSFEIDRKICFYRFFKKLKRHLSFFFNEYKHILIDFSGTKIPIKVTNLMWKMIPQLSRKLENVGPCSLTKIYQPTKAGSPPPS